MSVIIAMFTYSLVMSISPGPVNMISLSSSLNYGFRRTFPFVSGATIGFTLLLIATGLGVSELIDKFSYFYQILKYLGSAFIAYMGYKIIVSSTVIELKDEKLPLFSHGFLLQFLNPKAWVAAISGVSAFNPEGAYNVLFLFVVIYFIVCYISLASWAVLGSKIKILFKVKRNIQIFNILTGSSLMIIGAYLMLVN